MRSSRIVQTLAVAALAVSVLPSIAFSASDAARDGSVARGDELRLRADLEGSGTLMSGNADYRERETSRGLQIRFKVQIEDAEPGSEFSVFVDGTNVGAILTNSMGRGEIAFRTLSDDPDHLPDVPVVNPGSVITVGEISGTMN